MDVSYTQYKEINLNLPYFPHAPLEPPKLDFDFKDVMQPFQANKQNTQRTITIDATGNGLLEAENNGSGSMAVDRNLEALILGMEALSDEFGNNPHYLAASGSLKLAETALVNNDLQVAEQHMQNAQGHISKIDDRPIVEIQMFPNDDHPTSLFP